MDGSIYYKAPVSLLLDFISFREALLRERGIEEVRPSIRELREIVAAKLLGLFYSS